MTQHQMHQAQSSLSSHYIGGIGDWLRYHAWYRPTAEALVDNEDRVSYGELDRRVNLAADVLAGLGLPLLVGASRKSFLGRLLGSQGSLRPAPERDAATVALTTYLALHRPVWGVRVHDVRGTRDALAVVDHLTRPVHPAPLEREE